MRMRVIGTNCLETSALPPLVTTDAARTTCAGDRGFFLIASRGTGGDRGVG